MIQSGWLREVRFIRSASLDSDQLDFKIPSEIQNDANRALGWPEVRPFVSACSYDSIMSRYGINISRVKARVRARAMRRCGTAARCCSYRWPWL